MCMCYRKIGEVGWGWGCGVLCTLEFARNKAPLIYTCSYDTRCCCCEGSLFIIVLWGLSISTEYSSLCIVKTLLSFIDFHVLLSGLPTPLSTMMRILMMKSLNKDLTKTLVHSFMHTYIHSQWVILSHTAPYKYSENETNDKVWIRSTSNCIKSSCKCII